MNISEAEKLTNLAQVFLEPRNSTHRQYEALRAYFVDGLPSNEVAELFGYTPGSFRVLCHEFRQNPHREFFLPPQKGPRAAPKKDTLRERIIALRKQNLSIYDISKELAHAGKTITPGAVSKILAEEGFARLPRRRDEERPRRPRPEKAAVADVGELQLLVLLGHHLHQRLTRRGHLVSELGRRIALRRRAVFVILPGVGLAGDQVDNACERSLFAEGQL